MNYMEEMAIASAKVQAQMRDSQVDINGYEVDLLTNVKSNDLTDFGEVSYYTERNVTKIKVVTDLENWYQMMPFDGQGKVIETGTKKQFTCYVKTTQLINQGDLIRLDYSYSDPTVQPKYYQIKKVEVSSPIIPISKKITISPYLLPVKLDQTTNPRSDYSDSQPNFNVDLVDDFN
jgi:hypothetical protein